MWKNVYLFWKRSNTLTHMLQYCTCIIFYDGSLMIVTLPRILSSLLFLFLLFLLLLLLFLLVFLAALTALT